MVVNILLFHSLMAPSGLELALFVAILWGIVSQAFVRRFRELLKRESRLARRQCVATHVSFRQLNEQSPTRNKQMSRTIKGTERHMVPPSARSDSTNASLETTAAGHSGANPNASCL